MRLSCVVILGLALFQISSAQETGATKTQLADGSPRRDGVHKVDPTQTYHRVYAKVPLVGTGKRGDEIRPMFVPLLSKTSKDHIGIIAWQMQICDDGKSAIVEFVGATAKDLDAIINSKDPNVKVFERGKSAKADIEAEFSKSKKGFSLDSFQV